MLKPLIVGNWKMNGNRAFSHKLLHGILSGIDSVKRADVGVCVPFIFIPDAAEILMGSKVLLGSQNIADQETGAYTGEVSGAMLNEFGCKLAIVGHSERRALYSESNQLIAKRYIQSVLCGITPILCVGETLEQREKGETFAVIDEQISAVLDMADVDLLCQAVVAYEPVWAIGTGQTATADQAQDVHRFIRNRVAKLNQSIGDNLRILYGGSVKPDNASDLFAMPDIDGGLIGGASLEAGAFLSICNSV